MKTGVEDAVKVTVWQAANVGEGSISAGGLAGADDLVLGRGGGRQQQGGTDLSDVNELLDADEKFRKRDQLPSGQPGMATLADPSLAPSTT